MMWTERGRKRRQHSRTDEKAATGRLDASEASKTMIRVLSSGCVPDKTGF